MVRSEEYLSQNPPSSYYIPSHLLSPHQVKDRQTDQMLDLRLPVSGCIWNVTIEGELLQTSSSSPGRYSSFQSLSLCSNRVNFALQGDI